MQSEKMQSTQNLINELVDGYIQSKYNKEYLKEKIHGVFEIIIPHIATIVKNTKEREPTKLWGSIKEDERISSFFREAIEKIDRPIVIYIASKFENNQYFGTKIIEEALKWK